MLSTKLRCAVAQPNTYLILLCFLLATAFASLSGCGASSSSSATEDPINEGTEAQKSELYVSLTDAEGDFLTYEVAVTNISMESENGAQVNILPRTTEVDFAQYVEVSELLTVLEAPVGRYQSLSLSLDFSDSFITVQGENGEAIEAQVQDLDGDPLTQTQIEIEFSERDGFVIAPGVPAHITLDFDLDASNTIVIDGESATVTVAPVLVADTIFEESKPIELKGLLRQVDELTNSFSMAIRPFRVRSEQGYGFAKVFTDENTHFEIDGAAVDNEEGISALAGLTAGSAVMTEGQWNREDRRYIATHVFAGTSVPWSQADIVRGIVVSRENNLLNLKGAVLQLEEGEFSYRQSFSVSISELTQVLTYEGRELTIADLSVGSALFATGEIGEDGVLDAGEGLIRVLPSRFSGTVVSTSPLVVDLQTLNARRPKAYDFSGTGTSAETDADPDAYEVFSATIDTSDLLINDPIRARGYVNAFGAAPEDFNATTLINVADIRGHLVVNFEPESEMRVLSANAEGLVLNLEAAAGRHHIVRAGTAVDLKANSASVAVVPNGERGLYTIWSQHRIEVHHSFESFTARISTALESNREIVRFDAHGYYDGEENSFASKQMRIMIK